MLKAMKSKMKLGSSLTLACLLIPSVSNAILIGTLEDFTNGGGYFGEVTVEDTMPDTVAITATITVNGPTATGDIIGLWFGLNNYDVANNYSVLPGSDVTNFQEGDPVSNNLGQGNNLNGGSGAASGLFNVAFAIGSNGAGQGDYFETTSFSFSGAGLNELAFLNESIGMRVQSTSSPTFHTTSSKLLGGYTTPPTPVSEPNSLALLGIGLLGFAGFVKRKNRRS